MKIKLSLLMVLVLVICLAFSLAVYRQRARSYRAEAARQEQLARWARKTAASWSRMVDGARGGHVTAIYKGGRAGPPRIHDLELVADHWTARAKYHDRRREIFRRCAARPWLFPSPEPEPSQPPWPWSNLGVSLFLD